MWFLKLVRGVCGAFTGLGLLALGLGLLDQIFGFGIYGDNEWPAPFEQHSAPDGHLVQEPATFWTFFWQVAVMVAVASVIGVIAYQWIERIEFRQGLAIREMVDNDPEAAKALLIASADIPVRTTSFGYECHHCGDEFGDRDEARLHVWEQHHEP